MITLLTGTLKTSNLILIAKSTHSLPTTLKKTDLSFDLYSTENQLNMINDDALKILLAYESSLVFLITCT